jgi:3-oxoacyl-[acyl-carrier-protein] synthase III
MKFNNVVIESFAYQDPEVFITSEEIERRLAPVYTRLKLPQGRLELQTSIQARGMWGVGTPPSLIATQAALKTLEKSQFSKNDIDLVIHSSVCRDFLEPSTASVVHHQLGLRPECMSFDLSNACLGFLSAMMVASDMIDKGSIKTALVVTGENAGPLLEETIQKLNSDQTLTRKSIKKYIANLTIGSAGVAMILTRDNLASGHRLLGGASLSDTDAVKLCQGDGNTEGLMMETDSEQLLHAGVALATKTWEMTKSNLGWENESADNVICHQVGIAHRNLMYESLQLNLVKDYSTFEQYGNTGSAALPLTLVKAVEANKVIQNNKVALLGIGSGLHSIMLGVEW